MMRRISLLSGFGLLAVLLLVSTGGATTYHIDAVHSNVGFSIRHIVSRTSGAFTSFEGTVDYDPAHPEKSAVSATVDVASIDTNNGRRDGHLKSADFFDAGQYPSITFVSTSAEKQGDRLLVTGDLTLHGVTRQVMLPVEVLGVGTHPMSKAPVAGFSVKVVLKRSDFGVNNWTDVAGILGDEVTVTLDIEAAAKTGTLAANPCAKGKNPCNPCSKNPCNPCAKGNPCGK